MTDKEIIKALECCTKVQTIKECEEFGCPALTPQGCSYYLRTDDDFEGVIFVELIKDALDLINRQTADIARLEKVAEETYESAVIAINVAKAEAVRVFAKRLKDDISKHRLEMYMNGLKGTPRTKEITYECVEEYIDDLVKEMVGDNNG